MARDAVDRLERLQSEFVAARASSRSVSSACTRGKSPLSKCDVLSEELRAAFALNGRGHFTVAAKQPSQSPGVSMWQLPRRPPWVARKKHSAWLPGLRFVGHQPVWTSELLDMFGTMLDRNWSLSPQDYPHAASDVGIALRSFVRRQPRRACVVSSITPWIETLLLRSGVATLRDVNVSHM